MVTDCRDGVQQCVGNGDSEGKIMVWIAGRQLDYRLKYKYWGTEYCD